jgi:hypothetical protein
VKEHTDSVVRLPVVHIDWLVEVDGFQPVEVRFAAEQWVVVSIVVLRTQEHICVMVEGQRAEHCTAMLLWEWLEVVMVGWVFEPAMRLLERRCWLQKMVWPAGRPVEVRQLRVRSVEAEQALWEGGEVVQALLAVHQREALAEALKDCFDWGRETWLEQQQGCFFSLSEAWSPLEYRSTAP